uniref:Uncharacterized protein n=1 Tax=Arundo donax TaxID=35708 RepID=A0A0A9FG03_ARUDO
MEEAESLQNEMGSVLLSYTKDDTASGGETCAYVEHAWQHMTLWFSTLL